MDATISPVAFIFNPSLLLQYDAVTGNSDPLQFNNRKHSFRVGPDLRLNMIPNKQHALFAFNDPFFLDAIGRLSFSIEYHPYYETMSRTRNYLLDASLQYGLDAFGHFGLKASYQRGRDEDVGSPVNVYLVGLTGKI